MIDDLLRQAFGTGDNAAELGPAQVVIRAVAIYLAGITMVRVSENRFLGKQTAFDVILGFLLGSMLSRAVNGSAGVLPTIAGGVILIALHRILAHAAHRFDAIGGLFKGHPHVLVRDGVKDRARMRRSAVTDRDLDEALRVNGGTADVAKVAEARLERNGEISVVGRSAPRIVEVRVEQGVQTVRIELG